MGKPFIARRRHTGIVLGKNTHPVVQRLIPRENRRRAIYRAIVNANELELFECLGENGIDAFFKKILAIVRCNNCRN